MVWCQKRINVAFSMDYSFAPTISPTRWRDYGIAKLNVSIPTMNMAVPAVR